MPGLEKVKDTQTAKARLRKGPLGIGEQHDKPAARQFVLELINEGLVTVLFLEIPGDNSETREEPELRNGLSEARRCPFDKLLSKAILANQGGLPDADVLGPLLQIDGWLRSPRGIKYSDMIFGAMKARVRIVLCDKYFVRPDSASTSSGMADRNETVDKVFEEASFQSKSPERVGCVILFGAEHFESRDTSLTKFIGQSMTRDLPWIDLSN